MISIEQLSTKVRKFLTGIKMDVSLTVYDNISTNWFHLSREFEFAQLLILGLYSKSEGDLLAKSFGIAQRNVLALNNQIFDCFQNMN